MSNKTYENVKKFSNQLLQEAQYLRETVDAMQDCEEAARHLLQIRKNTDQLSANIIACIIERDIENQTDNIAGFLKVLNQNRE